MTRKVYLTLLTGLAAIPLSLAAVACGGDDDDDGGGETPSGNGASGQTTFDMLMNESDGNVFVVAGEKNPTLKVPASAKITVNLTNDGTAIHNMRFSGKDKKYTTADDAVSNPEFVNPGDKAVLVFTAPGDKGKYVYRCDIHPTDMLGGIEVVS